MGATDDAPYGNREGGGERREEAPEHIPHSDAGELEEVLLRLAEVSPRISEGSRHGAGDQARAIWR